MADVRNFWWESITSRLLKKLMLQERCQDKTQAYSSPSSNITCNTINKKHGENYKGFH